MLAPCQGAGLCIATAWDVSTEDGTDLEKPMLEALRLTLGSEDGKPHPASVRGSCSAGTVVMGPVVDAKLAAALRIVPPEPDAEK